MWRTSLDVLSCADLEAEGGNNMSKKEDDDDDFGASYQIAMNTISENTV